MTPSGTATSNSIGPSSSPSDQETETLPCLRFQRGSRPPNVAAWLWRDQHLGVTRLERRDATNDLMHPVRDRAEGVVIEARHLAGVDGAVGQHRVPALPDRCRPHRDRVEPGRAFRLQQQPVGVVKVAGLGQGMGDERCARESGPDVVATLARPARQAVCRRAARLRDLAVRRRSPARTASRHHCG